MELPLPIIEFTLLQFFHDTQELFFCSFFMTFKSGESTFPRRHLVPDSRGN